MSKEGDNTTGWVRDAVVTSQQPALRLDQKGPGPLMQLLVNGTKYLVIGNSGKWETFPDLNANLNFLDNKKVILGTGNDSQIYYDGSDLIFKPAVVGTGDVKIVGGGLHLVDSEATVYGTGEDATIKYDGTNLIVNPRVVGSGNFVITNVDIDSGAIDGTAIGAAVAAAGTFGTLIGTTIDGSIGSVTPAAIVGTTIDATTDFTVDGLVLTEDTITNDATLAITVVAAADITLGDDVILLTIKGDGTVDVNATSLDLLSSATLLNVGAAGNDWTASLITHKGNGQSKLERVTAGANTIASSLAVQSTSTGDMIDGFGPGVIFIAEDGAAADQILGTVAFIRAGADNTGDFVVETRIAGSANVAMKVSSGGQITVDLDSDLSTASTGGQVFDDYDDPMELDRYAHIGAPFITEEQRQFNRDRMVELGVIREETGARSGYHLVIQPMMRLLAGGVYQNRWRMDEQHKSHDSRLMTLEGRVKAVEKIEKLLRHENSQLKSELKALTAGA